MNQEDKQREKRRMMDRAIRRLNALEFVILGVVMVIALVAGALMAWVLESTTGVSFRLVWGVASLLFFIVPGVLVHRRERQRDDSEQVRADLSAPANMGNDG